MQISRRQAREWAIQMLTAADLNPPEDVDLFINEFWAQMMTFENSEGGIDGKVPSEKLRLFAEERVRGVLNNKDDIDAAITPLLDHWNLYRLGTVERSVLRMGVWEMKNSDVPKPIVINEAVDLVNWFSSPKSRTLINGVLDKYAKQIA